MYGKMQIQIGIRIIMHISIFLKRHQTAPQFLAGYLPIHKLQLQIEPGNYFNLIVGHLFARITIL